LLGRSQAEQMTDTQVSTIAIEPPTRLRMIGRVFGEL
jgi:hypothetical protein